MLEDFVLVADAARELGMTRWALWKAIERGQLRARRLGRDYLIARVDLTEYNAHRRPKGRPRTAKPEPPAT